MVSIMKFLGKDVQANCLIFKESSRNWGLGYLRNHKTTYYGDGKDNWRARLPASFEMSLPNTIVQTDPRRELNNAFLPPHTFNLRLALTILNTDHVQNWRKYQLFSHKLMAAREPFQSASWSEAESLPLLEVQIAKKTHMLNSLTAFWSLGILGSFSV